MALEGPFGTFPVALVGLDNGLYQGVTNHVALTKLHELNSVDLVQRVHGFNQTGRFVNRQVYLGSVSRDNTFRISPKAREEHEHLFRGRVLGFVENYEGMV